MEREWLGTCGPSIKQSCETSTAKILQHINAENPEIATLLRDESEQRWIQETGIRPENAKFSVIIPIHNEEASLPSLLSTLATSTIPTSVHANFIFVVNGSNDQSFSIVKSFIESLGQGENVSLLDENSVVPQYFLRIGNNHFTLVDMPQASKAHALDIGNKIALGFGSEISMNIDADYRLQPDTLPTMFRDTKKMLDASAGYLILGSGIFRVRRNLLSPFNHLMRKWGIKSRLGIDTDSNNTTPRRTGIGFMAWDSKWYERIGGSPKVVTEDMGLYLLGRKHGEIQTSTAAVWSYCFGTLGECVQYCTRIAKGIKQLQNLYKHDKEITQILKETKVEARTFTERCKFYKEALSKTSSTKERLALLTRIAGSEVIMFLGEIAYERDPQATTWSAVDSTKRA